MHSNDGCFAYIKEIVNGKSYIELGKEEEKAVKQALAGRMGDEELSKEINDLMQKDKINVIENIQKKRCIIAFGKFDKIVSMIGHGNEE